VTNELFRCRSEHFRGLFQEHNPVDVELPKFGSWSRESGNDVKSLVSRFKVL